MQILEAGPLGLRSAAFWLAGSEPRPTFLVMPMVHMGSRHFYDRVCKLLDECDIVLVEGVSHQITRMSGRLRNYVARSSKFNLTVQEDAMRDWLKANLHRLKRFDIPKDEFAKHWNALGFVRRWLYSLHHLVGFAIFPFIGSRQMLAEHLVLDDKRSREEILRNPTHDGASKIIVQERDGFMVNTLREYLANDFLNGKTIGVLVGAEHTRAVYHYLITQQRLVTIKSEWLTVFADNPEFDDQSID